jgi:hypothetical protein
MIFNYNSDNISQEFYGEGDMTAFEEITGGNI